MGCPAPRRKRPSSFPRIIGDVLQLRAALDLMAVQLVRRDESDEDADFPFSKIATDFDTLQSRNMHRASAQAIALLKSLKPYPGGNDPLRDLHDLTSRTSTKLLSPTSDMIGMRNFSVDRQLAPPRRIRPLRMACGSR